MFLIVFLFCLALIPASLLFNYSAYRSAYQEYDASQRDVKVTTTVYREPSVLSTFGIGLESVLLVLFNLIFFAAAYYSFTRYDVG